MGSTRYFSSTIGADMPGLGGEIGKSAGGGFGKGEGRGECRLPFVSFDSLKVFGSFLALS